MEFNLDVTMKSSGFYINGVFYHDNGISPIHSLSQAIANHICRIGQTLTGVYNRSVYWPPELQFIIDWTLSNRFTLSPSEHMLERAKKYNITQNCYKAALAGKVVEATVINGTLTKVVTRLASRQNPEFDNCYVVEFTMKKGVNIAVVRTVWLNKKDDCHRTLKRRNYVGGK